MRKRRSYVVAGLLAAGVLFAGCGGDDSESETAAEDTTTEEASAALSEDQYRTEVEGILTPLGEDLQAIGTETQSQTTPEGVAQGLGDAEAALETGVADLEAIQPPEELQEPHDRLIAALQEFQDATATAREGAEAGDLQAVATDYVQAATDFQTELTEVLQAYQDAGLELQPTDGGSGSQTP